MSRKFFYQVMGEVYGPLNGVDLRDKALAGDVTAETLCRIEDGDWVLARKLTNLFDEHDRPIPHEVIADAIPDYKAFREAQQKTGAAETEHHQNSAITHEYDEDAYSRSYFMLQLYALLCRVFGALGLAGVVISFILILFTQWSVPFLAAVLGSVAMGSFALLTFGEAIIGFVHLVEDARRSNELLERVAKNQERLAFRLEQRK